MHVEIIKTVGHRMLASLWCVCLEMTYLWLHVFYSATFSW
jgi:hypothetical protein